MLVLNILPPEHKKKEVEVVYLETLSKTNLLKRWQEAIAYPDRYIVAEAESMRELMGDIPARELVTLNEYLEEKNIELDKGEYHRLATRVTERYLKEFKVKPRVVARADSRGRFMRKSSGYEQENLWIIDEALKSTTHKVLPHKP
ncbi:hypothetical protein PCC6912_51040 [Chlorogloeopsis fritschii PCC 6912]|uniref:Uncharacterized protein n=1 Tax=Chlorogloeopsis fritschii PCC 6912 TaxID=211165 RepID=A0A3S1FBV6_CHLFR|nr:hypothetical protein [Chlorogloeopsis fritschii]RUR74926.1 hypothetical protein PCC6912_51040 [Chlorogloeopsis fritschii PCC 6912]